MPNGLPNRVPNGLLNGVPNGLPNRVPNRLHDVCQISVKEVPVGQESDAKVARKGARRAAVTTKLFVG